LICTNTIYVLYIIQNWWNIAFNKHCEPLKDEKPGISVLKRTFNINEEEEINTNPVSRLNYSSSAVLISQFIIRELFKALYTGGKYRMNENNKICQQ
jgi:hypothetical protein